MDELEYDSIVDTTIHQNNVKEVWEIVKMIMDGKIQDHDMSKLLPPEKECYDTYIPQLKQVQYGTEEYYAIRKKMQEEWTDIRSLQWLLLMKQLKIQASLQAKMLTRTDTVLLSDLLPADLILLKNNMTLLQQKDLQNVLLLLFR